MKQNKNYYANYQELFSDDHLNRMSDILLIQDTDRVAVLTSQKKDAPANRKKKMEIMMFLERTRKDIIEASALLEGEFSGLHGLTEKLKGLLPLTTAYKNKDNAALAMDIVELFQPLEVFHSKVQEQKQAEGEGRRKTRGASINQPLHLQVIKTILDLKDTIDRKIRKDKAEDMGKKFKPVSITPAQERRKFCQDRHDILDDAHKTCPYCGHKSVNSLLENDSVVAANQTDHDGYSRAKEVWDNYKRRLAEALEKGHGHPPYPKNPNNPSQEMRQAPKRIKLREITDVCCCKNSSCIMKESDHGSSCFLKCIDPSTGQRFSWDPMQRRCTCSICMCECPGVWHRADRQMIALGIDQARRNDATMLAASSGSNVAPETGLRRFLTQSIIGGVNVADAVARSLPSNASEENRKAAVSDAIMEGSAMYMTRNASSLLSDNSRHLMQSQFGQSTRVTLPGGQKIDTTALGASRTNLHTNNNRLGASATTVGHYLPGMKNHQQPSFENVTAEFEEASRQVPIADEFLGPIFHDLTRDKDMKPAAKKKEVICLDGTEASSQSKTPPPPRVFTQTITTASAAASSLSSNDQHLTSNQTVLRKERDERITNNALATFDNAVKYNNKKLHNNKAPVELSTPQKEERVTAKRRKKMLKKIKGDEAKVEVIQEIVGSTDKPISQAKLDIGEEVVLQRIERAQSESDNDGD